MNATENVELYRPTKCLINSERVISEFFLEIRCLKKFFGAECLNRSDRAYRHIFCYKKALIVSSLKILMAFLLVVNHKLLPRPTYRG